MIKLKMQQYDVYKIYTLTTSDTKFESKRMEKIYCMNIPNKEKLVMLLLATRIHPREMNNNSKFVCFKHCIYRKHDGNIILK